MFFVGLTILLILLLSGMILLVESSYLMGSILVGLGIILLIFLVCLYRKRDKKKQKESWDCLDCNASAINCADLSSMKKMDCDCDGNKGFDCDCSPN